MDYGIIGRNTFNEKPLKTEYYLTEWGEQLVPLLIAMNEWGDKYRAACKITNSAK